MFQFGTSKANFKETGKFNFKALHLNMFSNSSHDHKADQAIKNDVKKYPNCTYITQSSVECYTNQSNENNEQNQFICDTIKRIQRVCPNSAPVDIYTSKDTTNKPLNGGIDDIFEEFEGSIAGFNNQRHKRHDIFSRIFDFYEDEDNEYRPSARHPPTPHNYAHDSRDSKNKKKQLDHGQIDRQSIERI